MSATKLLDHRVHLWRSHGEEFHLKASLFEVSKMYQSFLVTLEAIPMTTIAVMPHLRYRSTSHCLERRPLAHSVVCDEQGFAVEISENRHSRRHKHNDELY